MGLRGRQLARLFRIILPLNKKNAAPRLHSNCLRTLRSRAVFVPTGRLELPSLATTASETATFTNFATWAGAAKIMDSMNI